MAYALFQFVACICGIVLLVYGTKWAVKKFKG